MKRWYLIVDKGYIFPLFDSGVEVWMVDFGQADHRNVARRIKSREQITPEKMQSPNVFFYKAEEEKPGVLRK